MQPYIEGIHPSIPPSSHAYSCGCGWAYVLSSSTSHLHTINPDINQPSKETKGSFNPPHRPLFSPSCIASGVPRMPVMLLTALFVSEDLSCCLMFYFPQKLVRASNSVSDKGHERLTMQRGWAEGHGQEGGLSWSHITLRTKKALRLPAYFVVRPFLASAVCLCRSALSSAPRPARQHASTVEFAYLASAFSPSSCCLRVHGHGCSGRQTKGNRAESLDFPASLSPSFVRATWEAAVARSGLGRQTVLLPKRTNTTSRLCVPTAAIICF